MSFDLIAWVRPIPASAAEADTLVQGRYEHGTDVFEPDSRLVAFRTALLALYPALEGPGDAQQSPWAMTPVGSNRLLEMNISWQAEDRVLLSIVELARKHRVVLYDPQGPDVHSPAGIPRSSGTSLTRQPDPPPWLPIVTIGGAVILCFALVIRAAFASHAIK